MQASIVISTYNRAEALLPTLEALARQDIPADDYEVLVVDDGSTDATPDVLDAAAFPYALRRHRLSVNRGVSAGRNVGLRHARGRNVIMISDDLIVPDNFIRSHVETLARFPGTWVVGSFTQLASLAETPFGRFLDELEQGFQRARLGERISDDIYELRAPTARNLSLPRADLDRVGMFDERFRVTCEDQDLAERASEQGIRFIYNASIECIHNDQAADLRRYCRFQQLGARDTVRLCDKYPDIHGNAQLVRANRYVTPGDGIPLASRKLAKLVLATRPGVRAIEWLIRRVELWRLPSAGLRRSYRLLIGLYTFRGVREGLGEVGGRGSRLARDTRPIDGVTASDPPRHRAGTE